MQNDSFTILLSSPNSSRFHWPGLPQLQQIARLIDELHDDRVQLSGVLRCDSATVNAVSIPGNLQGCIQTCYDTSYDTLLCCSCWGRLACILSPAWCSSSNDMSLETRGCEDALWIRSGERWTFYSCCLDHSSNRANLGHMVFAPKILNYRPGLSNNWLRRAKDFAGKSDKKQTNKKTSMLTLVKWRRTSMLESSIQVCLKR